VFFEGENDFWVTFGQLFHKKLQKTVKNYPKIFEIVFADSSLVFPI